MNIERLFDSRLKRGLVFFLLLVFIVGSVFLVPPQKTYADDDCTFEVDPVTQGSYAGFPTLIAHARIVCAAAKPHSLVVCLQMQTDIGLDHAVCSSTTGSSPLELSVGHVRPWSGYYWTEATADGQKTISSKVRYFKFKD